MSFPIPTNGGTPIHPPTPEMPKTGVAWDSYQNGIALSGGYRRPDCLYNIAKNILVKADSVPGSPLYGTEPSEAAIAAEIKNLVSIYNGAAKSHGWEKIHDVNDVTSEQLTNIISAFGGGT